MDSGSQIGVDSRMDKDEVLKNMHGAFLGALRQREQEIFSYLGILVPAVGGFIGLLVFHFNDKQGEWRFFLATVGILLILSLGAAYSSALGYNYRYLTFQLAKIEHHCGAKVVILSAWPRSPKEFRDRYSKFCTPPEIIKVFWLAFGVAILFVTISAIALKVTHLCVVVAVATLLLLYTYVFLPIHFGHKLSKQCGKEPQDWPQPPDSSMKTGSLGLGSGESTSQID